jgi:hypothetical protein
MKRLLLSLTAAATVLAAGALVPSRAEASPLSASIGANAATEALSPIQNVAFCFYVDGWNGPGLYECGFRHRQGLGWHGHRDGDHRDGRNRQGRAMDGDRRGHQSGGPGFHLQTEGRGGRY